MRLRHRKWAEDVVTNNSDIGFNLENFDLSLLTEITDLEIGSGCGEFLIESAKKNPEKRFLGVEINKNAFAIALKKAQECKESVHNFLFLNAPIEKVLPEIGEKQLDNVYINFPDPWPKARHEKRRLSYPSKLNEYSRILKNGGKVYFRTDNVELFNATKAYFNRVELYSIECVEPFISEDSDILAPTEYEKKFRNKGVDIHLLIATSK